MQKIFLSFHFDEPGKRLADMVSDLVASHGLLVVTGARLDGQALTEGVKAAIDQCDALICLVTRRPDDAESNWIERERAYADGAGKRVLAVREKGLQPVGMYAENEYLIYDPADAAPTLIELSARLGKWGREGGRYVEVQIEPTDAADFAINGRNARVRYRCVMDRTRISDWQDAVALPEPGGVIAYLKGVAEGAKVQIKIAGDGETWESKFEPQMLRLRLERL